jgi:hypothetical protein
MCENLWKVAIRVECMRMENFYHDMNADESHPVFDIFYASFRRAYSVSSDWPAPYTRVDTFTQHIDCDLVYLSHERQLEMRNHARSRGVRGGLLTLPNSSHVLRTILRITGVAYRGRITIIIKECIQIYADKIPFLVQKCPQTWLFVESAHGLLEQCADGRYPSSRAMVDLASLLPSKQEWMTLRDEMKFNIGSIEANTHMWCWFRLHYLFDDHVNYTKIWASDDSDKQNASMKRSCST